MKFCSTIVYAGLIALGWVLFFTTQLVQGQVIQGRVKETAETLAGKTDSKSADFMLDIPGVKELSATGRPLSKFVPESVSAAMKLRESLLERKLAESEAESQATVIQKLSGCFAAAYRNPEKNGLPPTVPTLFDFSSIDFESAIRGTESCPEATEIFDPFTGKWYGLWAEMEVDHHWSRVVSPDQHSFGTDFPGLKIGWQYAWIGDGYGVNHCVHFAEQGKTKGFILGYTEHLKDGDFGEIVARRPHVGIYAGAGKLIWITAREVFFEESHSNADGELDSYSIIGFNYTKESGKEFEEQGWVVRDGFVAQYSADPRHRIPFIKLELRGSMKLKLVW